MSSPAVMKNLPTKLFRVYDTVTGTYWSTDRGKSVWTKKGAAANGWNNAFAYRYGQKKFSQQDRYMVHTFATMGWENVTPIPVRITEDSNGKNG